MSGKSLKDGAIAASGTGALVSDQAASRLAPTGFDHTIAEGLAPIANRRVRKRFAIFSSWGNDSVALIQLIHEHGLGPQCFVAYTNTGWAHPAWPERVACGTAWAESLGFECVELATKGFEKLVTEPGKGRTFPTGLRKFCTEMLKIKPAKDWLNIVDPDGHLICCVGMRRDESLKRAGKAAGYPASQNHGYRFLWHPLIEFSDADRDAMVAKTPLELLPHRSDECEPCIFSSRADLRRVTPGKVDLIRRMEADTGRTMFRAKAYAGAVGIDEVMRWAWSERGQYLANPAPTLFDYGEDGDLDDGTCETGMCGS